MRWMKNSFVMPSDWQNSVVSSRPLSSFIITMMSYAGWLYTSRRPLRSVMAPRDGNSIFLRKALLSAL